MVRSYGVALRIKIMGISKCLYFIMYLPMTPALCLTFAKYIGELTNSVMVITTDVADDCSVAHVLERLLKCGCWTLQHHCHINIRVTQNGQMTERRSIMRSAVNPRIEEYWWVSSPISVYPTVDLWTLWLIHFYEAFKTKKRSFGAGTQGRRRSTFFRGRRRKKKAHGFISLLTGT